MLLEQRREESIQRLITPHALGVVVERHQFDMKNDEHHPKRALVEDRASDLLCRLKHTRRVAKRSIKCLSKAGEELLMLEFFIRKANQRTHVVRVAKELRTCLLHHRCKNELFDE